VLPHRRGARKLVGRGVKELLDEAFRVLERPPCPRAPAWSRDVEERIEELRLKYAAAADAVALAVLGQIGREPEMHRHYSDYYAYEFFVARR